ncbi:MAG: YidB family protein [Desulfomonilaceae bacterium]
MGNGENLLISSEQIQQVLGSGQIQQIADKLGISAEEASGSLAEMLPQIVNKVTPGGSVARQDLLHQGLGMITDKLFGK